MIMALYRQLTPLDFNIMNILPKNTRLETMRVTRSTCDLKFNHLK
jgi:hypothetical protein